MFPGLPCFYLILNTNRRTENRGGLGMGPLCRCVSYRCIYIHRTCMYLPHPWQRLSSMHTVNVIEMNDQALFGTVRVRIKGYSFSYFNRIAVFVMPYHWTFVKGGTRTYFIDAWVSNESTKHIWAPPLTEVQRYSALTQRCNRNLWQNNLRFLHGTATFVFYPRLPQHVWKPWTETECYSVPSCLFASPR